MNRICIEYVYNMYIIWNVIMNMLLVESHDKFKCAGGISTASSLAK